jgi:NAD(P)-dependent dehydrogenase (short-subunit alcohol dehydrogenase family)
MTNDGKRVAWVTGGGTGIGEAGAEALAADGWTVVVSGRRQQELDRVVAQITGKGGKAEAIVLDVSSKADVNKVADAIVAKHGRIDLLVNSAGVNVPKRSWEEFDLDGWNKVVDINLNGVLYCMRAVLPAMRKQNDQACGASADPFLQYGRMRQWASRLLPVTGRGRHPHPQIAARAAERGRAGKNAAAGRLRPHHRLCREPAAARLRQRDPDQPDA